MPKRPAPLRDLSWELPRTFLGLDPEENPLEGADAVLFPVPYESTTSYITPSCLALSFREAKNLRAHSILAFSTPLSWRVDMEPLVSATK